MLRLTDIILEPMVVTLAFRKFKPVVLEIDQLFPIERDPNNLRSIMRLAIARDVYIDAVAKLVTDKCPKTSFQFRPLHSSVCKRKGLYAVYRSRPKSGC